MCVQSLCMNGRPRPTSYRRLHLLSPRGRFGCEGFSSVPLLIAVLAGCDDVGCSIPAATTFGTEMFCGAAVWALFFLGRNHGLVAVVAATLLELEGVMAVFGDARRHVYLQWVGECRAGLAKPLGFSAFTCLLGCAGPFARSRQGRHVCVTTLFEVRWVDFAIACSRRSRTCDGRKQRRSPCSGALRVASQSLWR